MCGSARHSKLLQSAQRHLLAACAAGFALAACGVAGSGDPASWAGADALQTGRGKADATAHEDAADEACAATVDVGQDSAAVEPVSGDADQKTPEVSPADDGAATPDAPTFDAIADFGGWDGGDLGTATFDGAVFQELPPFPDVEVEVFTGETAKEVGPETSPDIVMDASSETGDAIKDSAPDQSQPDAGEVQAETVGEVVADLPADPGPDTVAPDALAEVTDADAVVDTPDAGADLPKEIEAETGSDATFDAATDAVTDTVTDTATDAGADSASDAVVDVQETLPETTADAKLDIEADAQADAQADLAPDTDGGGDPCTAQTCDDGEPCTIDLCGMAGGCTHLPLDDGDPCAEGTCQQALCSRNTPSSYGISCKAIKAADAKAKSGVWWIDPDGPFTPISPFAAWCDMEGDGGGWTLLAKVAADKSELGYDAAYWTGIGALHPERPRFDDREARLTSYWALPFSQLRVGLKATKQTTWLVANIQASSLFHLIVQSKFVQLTVPEANWLGLLPGAQLLGGCRVQGFNAHPGSGSPFDYARARVGIVAANGTDCTSPGSRIGIGLGGSTCGQSAGIAAGAAAGCLDAGGPVNLPATGYLFAR